MAVGKKTVKKKGRARGKASAKKKASTKKKPASTKRALVKKGAPKRASARSGNTDATYSDVRRSLQSLILKRMR